MAITSQNINEQSFDIDRKGYNIDQVDVFLEHVANEIDLLNEEIARLTHELAEAKKGEAEDASTAYKEEVKAEEKSAEADDAEAEAKLEGMEQSELTELIAKKDAEIAELNEKLSEKQANDSAISQALIIAQRSADEIIVKANAQAAEAMQDAREEADRILSRANADKQDVMDAIRKLEDDREDAREGYADLLRNLIDDANHKLNELGYDDDIDNIPGVGANGAPAAATNIYAADTTTEIAADLSGTGVIAEESATAAAAIFEKDLSGYGDVEEDFEDVE